MLLITPTQTELRAVEPSVCDLVAAGHLELITFGIGTDCAATLCRQLGARARLPETVVLVGVAGGLDPALRAGDAVLASAALYENGRRAPCTVVPLPGATVGPMLTVRRALYTPAEKAAGRTTGALAVEMEAYPLAAWAAARGLPFVHARVILDPLDEALPGLGDALDEYGRLLPGSLLRHLLVHPSHAAAVVRLLRRSQAIAPALGSLAKLVAEAWLPRGRA